MYLTNNVIPREGKVLRVFSSGRWLQSYENMSKILMIEKLRQMILMKTNPRKKIAKDRKVIPDPIDDRKFQE